MHMATTPIGILGVVGLIRLMTKSTFSIVALCGCYMISLLPVVPIGIFGGTTMIFFMVVFFATKFKLSLPFSIALIVIGYFLQDVAHLIAGEKTYQSSYTKSDTLQFDLSLEWAKDFGIQAYYLVPLCVHITLPLLNLPSEINKILNSPMPCKLQGMHTFSYLVMFFFVFAFGSYCLDSRNYFCCFPGAPYFYRVLRCNMNTNDKESRKQDLALIRKWVMDNNPPETTTSHWWYKDLDKEIKDAFKRCAYSSEVFKMFRSLFSQTNYCVDVIDGMNEIYVTGPGRQDEAPNSDQVFYTSHVDGPWGFIPFVSVYRCIVGMDRNHMITTHFPLANLAINACEGDVLAFDFNREVHYISRDETKKAISDKQRVNLKLHYAIYPWFLFPLGKLMKLLNVRYNILFRALFLKTIAPVTLYDHFLAWNVNTQTIVYEHMEQYLGIRNLIYIIFAGALWWSTNYYAIFFVLTSFVHYCRYISTYYVRKHVDFGSFKRDVLVFKTLAVGQMIWAYAFPSVHYPSFQLDPISIFMIISGYLVSMKATKALGIDRTYFAAELGLVEPKWITEFPYGYIPHPMIVSQIWALLGFQKADHFRQQWPYLIPIHITFYLIHMMQEHFNIYRTYKEEENDKYMKKTK